MIDKGLLPKAYVEVLEIIKYIPKNDYYKIPKEILQNMQNEKDINYTYTISCFDNFQNQEMLKETEAILAVLYRDYWATPEQKVKILNKEKKDMQIIEIEKTKKYNPDNIFHNRQNIVKESNIILDNHKQNIEMIDYNQQKWYKKIFTKILRIFKIKY